MKGGFDTESGERLVRALDADHFPLPAAVWSYRPDDEEWRLVLASPLVDKPGPRYSYDRLLKVIRRLKRFPLSLRDVSLVSPKDPLISLLRTAIATGPGINGIRFSRNSINGVFIEDAFIYRLTKS